MKNINSLRYIGITSVIFTTATILASGSAYADTVSCQDILGNHYTWANQAPNGYTRVINITMVSNYTDSFFATQNSTESEVTYINTALRAKTSSPSGISFSLPKLTGTGEAMFNTRKWGQVIPDNPFDPGQTDTWTINLTPLSNSLSLSGQNFGNRSIPLNCETSLISGTYIHYTPTGNFSLATGYTKYILHLSRNQWKDVAIPR
jgi:hypothetical protein